MLDIYWLLCVCIRTIEHADNTGSLFAFTSEFYLNVAMNAYSALKNYFSPANGMDELPGKDRPPSLQVMLEAVVERAGPLHQGCYGRQLEDLFVVLVFAVKPSVSVRVVVHPVLG